MDNIFADNDQTKILDLTHLALFGSFIRETKLIETIDAVLQNQLITKIILLMVKQ